MPSHVICSLLTKMMLFMFNINTVSRAAFLNLNPSKISKNKIPFLFHLCTSITISIICMSSQQLQIWDTAGQERFRKSMVPHYYRNVQAIVYVYDVTKLASFENLSQWMAECESYNAGRALPSVLVGNKCDSPANSITVTTNVAQRFADRHDMALFETSARDEDKADHVESIFVTLIYKLMTSKSTSVPASPEDGAVSSGGVHTGRLIEMRPRIEPRPERCSC